MPQKEYCSRFIQNNNMQPVSAELTIPHLHNGFGKISLQSVVLKLQTYSLSSASGLKAQDLVNTSRIFIGGTFHNNSSVHIDPEEKELCSPELQNLVIELIRPTGQGPVD